MNLEGNRMTPLNWEERLDSQKCTMSIRTREGWGCVFFSLVCAMNVYCHIFPETGPLPLQTRTMAAPINADGHAEVWTWLWRWWAQLSMDDATLMKIWSQTASLMATEPGKRRPREYQRKPNPLPSQVIELSSVFSVSKRNTNGHLRNRNLITSNVEIFQASVQWMVGRGNSPQVEHLSHFTIKLNIMLL